jgi:hypothetical protein
LKHAILPQFQAVRPAEDEGRGEVLVSQEESAERMQVRCSIARTIPSHGTFPVAAEGPYYVRQSTINGAGGGLFAGRLLGQGEYLGKYTGQTLPSARMQWPSSRCRHGYLMRTGAGIIDAYDVRGRLRLADGRLVDVHDYTHADWGALGSVGLKWEGHTNLLRFINCRQPRNVTLGKGGHLTVAEDIPRGTELVVGNYGKDFWDAPPTGGRLVGHSIHLLAADVVGRVSAFNPIDGLHSIEQAGTIRREQLSKLAWVLVPSEWALAIYELAQ